MTNTKDPCHPGSHPHQDQRNWHPAETAEAYFQNCREGLEEYSERRMAKLMGVSRIDLWRCRMLAEIPQELFDRLLAGGVRSSRELAKVGLAFTGKMPAREVECCPHCGGVVRMRGIGKKAAKITKDWLAEAEASA